MTINRVRGFTLLELLTAMAVAVITLGIGVPSFATAIENQRRTTAVNDLVAAANLARSEALKRAVHVTVCRSNDRANCASGTDAGWETGWIVFANADSRGIAVRSSGEELIRVFAPVGQGARMRGANGLGSHLTFRPTGEAWAPGSIVYCDARGAALARAVIVERVGKIYASETDYGGADISCDG